MASWRRTLGAVGRGHAARRAACVAAAALVALALAAPVVAEVSPHGRTPTLSLRHVHNFPTQTRWYRLHRGDRVLETMVVTPKIGRSVPIPVIEFAHGWHSNPTVYAAMLRAWASAGFLVISPTSPGMARGPGLLPQGAASIEQAEDLPAVLTQVLRLRLGVTPDPKRIALAGHSDGGCTVADMAFNRRFRDNRIDVYFIFSGAQTPINAGPGLLRANNKPVFVADSRADQYGDFPSSAAIFRAARTPKVFVAIGRGDTHLPPWSVSTLFHQRLWNATIDFASWAFTGQGAALDGMVDDLSTPGFGVNLRT